MLVRARVQLQVACMRACRAVPGGRKYLLAGKAVGMWAFGHMGIWESGGTPSQHSPNTQQPSNPFFLAEAYRANLGASLGVRERVVRATPLFATDATLQLLCGAALRKRKRGEDWFRCGNLGLVGLPYVVGLRGRLSLDPVSGPLMTTEMHDGETLCGHRLGRGGRGGFCLVLRL